MELLTYALWKTGVNVSAAQYSEALSQWDHASYIHDQLHDQYPLFLTPTNAQPAPRVDHDLIKPTDRKRMENITEFSPVEQRQLIYDQWLPALTYTPFTEQANMTGEQNASANPFLIKGIIKLSNKEEVRADGTIFYGRFFRKCGLDSN